MRYEKRRQGKSYAKEKWYKSKRHLSLKFVSYRLIVGLNIHEISFTPNITSIFIGSKISYSDMPVGAIRK